jgi:glycosyltransferase involved in cell wall biosynthesis
VDKVKFLPFRPVDQVPYVLSAGDLHLITIKHGLEGVVVPSKLYSTLAAGRPILALAPEGSDVARVVRRLDCGVVVDPDDPAAVAAIVKELALDRNRLAQMGERAFEAAGEFARHKELQHFRFVVEGVT